MSSQIRFRIVIVTIIVALGVSTRAINDWVSPEALGDVAVSFNDRVHVFDNADPSSDPEEFFVTGVNGGLAFDASLNLFVTNSNIAPALGEPVHKVVITGASALQTPFVQTQANPRSIVFAGNGTFYVASPGSPATIRRYKQTAGYPNPKAFALDATFANIPTDSTACIGIDLHPDQRTLYYVSGGRTIRTATGVDTATGNGNNSPTFGTLPNTLPNPGTACGLRLLAPRDVRETLPATSLSSGGILVADGRNIKRVDQTTGLVIGAAFNAGDGNDSQKQWIDVALDPNTADFWGVDAGFWKLAKFRINSPASVLSLTSLDFQPRGVAVNGELRAAQTTRILNLPTTSEARFLEKPFEHAWKATAPEAVSLAIQTYEVKYNADSPAPEECPVSLDVRCRLQKFDNAVRGNPVPKAYSRDRSVVYREILLSTLLSPDVWTISFVFPGNDTDKIAGAPCVPGSPDREGSSAVLRDPHPHDLFSIDPSIAFYGGDDVIPIKSRGNDSIVVDRDDGEFNLRIIKPTPLTVAQLGSSLPIAVEATVPPACTAAPDLETKLVLTVVNVSDPDDPVVGDSRGFLNPPALLGNGGIFAKVANQYRTNMDLTKGRFQKGKKYRLCISALAAETTESQQQLGLQPPPAGEVCQDITIKP